MSRTSTTVAVSRRPSLAEMKAALATHQPEPATPSDEPLAIKVGRTAAAVPTFFSACLVSYKFHRMQNQ